MSRKKPKKTPSSRGGSKIGKRIREGNRRPSKKRNLRCSQCGRYFANLGEINQHYRAAGHIRRKHPAKKLKLDSSKYSAEQIERAVAMLELLNNPVETKRMIVEAIQKRLRRRDFRYDR